MRGERAIATVGAVLAAVLAACSGPPAPAHTVADPPSAPATRTSAPVTSAQRVTASGSPSHRPSTSAASTSTSAAASGASSLPRGGTTILGRFRVVADYGTPGAPVLGILGASDPDSAARDAIRRAKKFRGYGLPVLPAMELITTVAQGSPGPDGDYSTQIPTAQIERYLRVAHEHDMLLILDLQPGRASFISQAKAIRHYLLDPSVGVGLDPEWKVTSGAPGGGRIGSATAASINAVGSYLADLVRDHHLPQKLMVVHEFTSTMLPDRQNIKAPSGVDVSIHADGFGSESSKIAVFHQLHLPGRPFGTGFKLFLVHDRGLMSPHDVMALRPRPDVITYQ